MSTRRAFSKAPWEDKVGYCRALRTGSQIFVTGTVPITEDGSTFAPNQAYAQARRCLEVIGRSLEELDASLADVVRTRMFVTDIEQWAEYGRAHRETFEDNPPATTMVEVRRLIREDMLIEIEVDAVVGPRR